MRPTLGMLARAGPWLLLAIAVAAAARAQELSGEVGTAAPSAEGNPSTASSRELERRFAVGRELFSQGNYSEGVSLLQSILDAPEDAFFAPNKDQPASQTGLKFEAQSLLGSMPAAGRRIYEQQYGPAARRLLTEAVAESDLDRLAVVARRYFHTQAGYEAMYRLASDHLDREQPLSAATGFERLRQVEHADDQFEPMLSLKAALSWHGALEDDKARAILAALKQKYRRSSVSLGGLDVRLFDDPNKSLDWLAKAMGRRGPRESAGSHPVEWTMVRGDMRRNAAGAGGGPHLNRGWHASTAEGATDSPEHDAILAKAVDDRRAVLSAAENTARASIPAGQPLVVRNLVIARSLADLRAYDAVTGKLVWASGEKDQTLIETLRATTGPNGKLPATLSLLSSMVARRGWDDLTWGTMSSDGKSVFCIEEAGFSGIFPGGVPPRHQLNREFNRLVAYDVPTGRAIWEAGGSQDDGAYALAGAYFLGAPLVLDGRLYCLAEFGSEVRLVVIDPRTGRADWSQLLSDNPGAFSDPQRRQSGLAPAFDGGVLVCPIGSDQTIAIDLTARSLLWRYRLRSAAELYDPRRQQPLLFQHQRSPMPAIQQDRWLDAQPIIAGARVLLTPRDVDELYCLNLFDGSLAWKNPRGEALFVAGVHEGNILLVGKTFVQALKLADGSPAWAKPTSIPVPSGRGFFSGDNYYLPLSTAEVATLDARDGRILSRAKSFEGRVPGNLVGVEGAIVSQGVEFVEGYSRLDSLENEIALALEQNPDDAGALALRGEIRLGRGQTRAAYADLHRALELNSGDVRVRELLVGSLLEGLRVDYSAYQELHADIEKLLVDPLQRSTFLWLQAQGLLRSGEKGAAFEALLRFADPDVAHTEFERLDSTLVVRRDRLVRTRAAQLVALAGEPERTRFGQALASRVSELLEGDGSAQRRFLEYFGQLPQAQVLWRQLVGQPIGPAWLEGEFMLQRAARLDEAGLEGQATARLAELLIAAGRPHDAGFLAARIGREWPDALVLNGRTGRELVAQWQQQPELAQALEGPLDWPQGRVVAEHIRAPAGGGATVGRPLSIGFDGERGPFFSNVSLEIDSAFQGLQIRDGLGRAQWPKPLKIDFPAQFANNFFSRAYACDHLLLVSVGTELTAIDTLGTAERPGPRVIWRMSLSEMPLAFALHRFRPRGRMPILLGEPAIVGPFTRDSIAVLRGSRLTALEPLTGQPLWVRDGLAPASDLFGDEEFLLVAPPDAEQAAVYRMLDGEFLGMRRLPAAEARLGAIGRRLVFWEPSSTGRPTLALRDMTNDEPLWRREFPVQTQVTLVEGVEAAVLEPTGRFSILSLADGREIWSSVIEPPSPRTQQLLALRTRDRYIVACNEQVAANLGWMSMATQHELIHGDVYGFDRATGRRVWPSMRIEGKWLDRSQPADLPVLTLLTVPRNAQRGGGGPFVEVSSALTCLDKRSGRIVFQQQTHEGPPFVDFHADPENHRLDIKLPGSVVRLKFTDTPWPEE